MKKQQVKKRCKPNVLKKNEGECVRLIMIMNILGLLKRNEQNTEASDSEVVVFQVIGHLPLC